MKVERSRLIPRKHTEILVFSSETNLILYPPIRTSTLRSGDAFGPRSESLPRAAKL